MLTSRDDHIVPAIRVSNSTLLSWHQVGARLNSDTSSTTCIFKSQSRVVELPGRQTFIRKTPSRTSFVVKLKKFADKAEAETYVETSDIGTLLPHLKIKPAVTVHSDDKEFPYYVFIVMEELKGQTLAELLFDEPSDYAGQKQLSLSAIETVEIMLEIAWDLQSKIHVAGIVHRDITPANVMLDRSVSPPVARIFDFDYCKAASVVDGQKCGTPLFMSPEAFAGQNKTEKVDVYGLAWLYYLLLRGKFPKMISLDDARRCASSYEPENLFQGMHDLHSWQKKPLANLLKSMFNPSQEQRCSLQHCMDVLETVLFDLRFNSSTHDHRANLLRSYNVGRTLRLFLLNVAKKSTVSDEPSQDVLVYMSELFDCLPASPEALSMFLSALRVETFKHLTTVESIKQKARDIIASFADHYRQVKDLQAEVSRLHARLLQEPVSKSLEELAGIKSSIEYLLRFYGPYFWSFDNLALIDRKLAKMAGRAHTVVEVAHRELAEIEAVKLKPSVAEWRSFQQGGSRLFRPAESAHIRDEKDLVTGKRKLY